VGHKNKEIVAIQMLILLLFDVSLHHFAIQHSGILYKSEALTTRPNLERKQGLFMRKEKMKVLPSTKRPNDQLQKDSRLGLKAFMLSTSETCKPCDTGM